MPNLKVYLDNCCYNRPFDDKRILKNRLEAEAKLFIQSLIKDGRIDLVWSYMNDYENNKNPDNDRKLSIDQWFKIASHIVIESIEMLSHAKGYNNAGLRVKDALHLACAVQAACDYFITTDRQLINKNLQIKQIEIINPLTFIERYGEDYENKN